MLKYKPTEVENIPLEQLSLIQEYAHDVAYYAKGIFLYFPVKALLSVAMITLFYLYDEACQGNSIFVIIWLVFYFIDFILGSIHALSFPRGHIKAFTLVRWKKAAVKFFFYLLCIGMAGAINYMLWHEYKFKFLLNAAVIILVLTEAGSILKNMRNLGVPVPIFEGMHKAVSKKINVETIEDHININSNHDNKN